MDKNDNNNSIGDFVEYQKNQFNPGYYIGTGKLPPSVKANGNALPLAIVYIILSVSFLVFYVLILASGEDILQKIFSSDIANKIFYTLVFLAIEAFFVRLSIVYSKKAASYFRKKREIEADESIDDGYDAQLKLMKRTCPNCGKLHDIDYPKCPYCKYNYSDKTHM